MKARGKGLLIAAGVLLLISGVFGLIFVWGLTQAVQLLQTASPVIFGMSWDILNIFLIIMIVAYIVFGIVGLVFCGKPDMAGVLVFQGIVLLIFTIIEIILLAPHFGFSILSFISPGIAIMYIAGAVMNSYSPQTEYQVHYIQSVPTIPAAVPVGGFCSECGSKLPESGRVKFCPSCGENILNNNIACVWCKNFYDKSYMYCPHCGNGASGNQPTPISTVD